MLNEVMRSILKQFSCSNTDHSIWQPTVRVYAERREQLEEEGCEPTKLSTKECVDLVLNFTEENPTTIVIDALDECDAMS